MVYSSVDGIAGREAWNVEKRLATQLAGKEKMDKYRQNCLEMRKDFTPMVYSSVDGIAGREAQNAEERLATQLAGKWNHEYSQTVYYVRVRMAIAVVQANSLIIRGSRD